VLTGEADGLDNVGDPRATNDQAGTPIENGVPDDASGVIGDVARLQEFASYCAAKSLDVMRGERNIGFAHLRRLQSP
jgi:hypothetical protein